MSAASEEARKKNLIVYSVFGVLALVFVVYAYNAFFSDSGPTPQTQMAPVAAANPSNAKPTSEAKNSANNNAQNSGQGVAPGVAATKMASTSSSLDPTLDESAMLRTESLVYTGSGRNIFSLVYMPPTPVALPKNLPSARPSATATVAPPVDMGPPPPPPINLKFFGTAVRANGVRQAFLLSGEDVYLAAQGDIVARKYKIVGITSNSVQVEDLQYKNTQSLPLQAN